MSGLTFEKALPDAVARAEELPSLPTVAVEILRLCEDEHSTLEGIAAALQRDPALAAKLLRVANSALFSPGHEVTTLKAATRMLGLKAVKLMSLSFSLAQQLALSDRGRGGFDYHAYWHRSLTAAVTARALASRLGHAFAEEAFLAGLLSHLGQLVLAECMGERYVEVLAECGPCPSAADEEARLGFTHGEIAGSLLARWRLPEMICLPVAYASHPADLPAGAAPETRELTRILAATVDVVGLLCHGRGREHLSALEAHASSYLGLGAEALDAFLLELEPAIHEMAELLAIELPRGRSHAEVLARARSQIVRIGLDTSADLQAAVRRADTLEHENHELARRATTDALTGLANRAAFDERLAAEMERRSKSGVSHALGLLMLDIDRFKAFNDAHGHQAGDQALAAVGRLIRKTVRASDFCARYGGEEFALILPQTTPYLLRTVANRVREAIERAAIAVDGETLSVTASFGGACVGRTSGKEDGPLLVRLADRFLYRAKQNGRNRVEIYGRTQFPGREA